MNLCWWHNKLVGGGIVDVPFGWSDCGVFSNPINFSKDWISSLTDFQLFLSQVCFHRKFVFIAFWNARVDFVIMVIKRNCKSMENERLFDSILNSYAVLIFDWLVIILIWRLVLNQSLQIEKRLWCECFPIRRIKMWLLFRD